MGPVFSHNAEYRCANPDLLFRLRFIHCAMVSPFIIRCFSFSLTDYWKGEKSQKWCWLIITASSYYVTQVAKCMWIWLSVSQLLKLLSAMLISLRSQVCSDWFHKLQAMMISCICSWAVICQYSRCCDVTSFSPCTDSSHELWDLKHFMSEQIDLHIFKAITAASCVDIIANKCLNKYN